MRAGLRKFLKYTLGSVLALVALVALLLGAFGYIVGLVPEYRVQVQDWVSDRSGLVVEFRTLSARLRAFGPELVFDDPVVRTPDRTRVLASATRGSVGFDLWNSIANGRLTAGRFSLDQPEIHLLRTREGRIQLLGQSSLPEREWKPVPLEYIPVGAFQVRDAVVSYRDERYDSGPWSLSGVSFSLQRSIDVMALDGSAVLPRSLGRTLNFHAYVAGPLEQAAALVSTFRVDGQALDLAGWVNALPPHWPVPQAGQGSLEITGTLRGPQLEQLDAQVQMQGLVITTPAWELPLPAAQPLLTVEQQDDGVKPPAPITVDQAHRLEYDRLAFKAEASRMGSQWSLTVDELQALREGSQWHAKQIAARWSHDETAQSLQASADRIELDGLWPLLAYLPQNEQLARLRALQATGTLRDLQLSMQRQGEQPPQYTLQVSLDDLGLAPVGRAPGISGLNGTITADQGSGQWQLTAREPRFSLPWMFHEVLDASLVEGRVQWQREASAWRVFTDQLQVQAEDGQGQAQLSITVPDDGTSPLIDLRAQGNALQVASTAKYVRGDKLRAQVMEWFDTAFIAGQLDDVDVALKGALRRFPFRDGGGEFVARAKVSGVHLAYQPDWQPLTQAQANVAFRNQGMSAQVHSADLGGLHVTSAQVGIADFRTPVLQIQGAGKGDVGRGLKLVRDSPLGPVLGDLFAALDGHGALDARLNMMLPLQQLDDREVEVVAQVTDATVTLRNVAGAITALQGDLTIRNDLVADATLQGEWLDGPLHVRIEQQGATHAMLSADGQATAASLQRLLSLPPAVALSGRTPWHMSMRIDSASAPESSQRSITIQSDLQGLGIDLPEPVGKVAQQSRDLQLTLDIDGSRAMLARGFLGDMRALVRVRRSTDGWLLDRGSVRADAVTPALPAHRGLRLEGTIERFVLDDWLRLANGGGKGRPLSDVLQAANVRVGEFQLFGYRWPQVRGILQATEGGWRVDVEGANAVGHVLIPEKFTGDQPLRASMERLVLTGVERVPEAEPGTPLDPRVLPNMQMYVGDFYLGERSVGEVELQATRVSQGLRLDSVTVKGRSAQASGRGQWLQTVDGPHTSLTASIESTDVAATLRALGYTEFIQAKQGAIRADLSWQGGFEGNFLGRASGAISVDAQSGQLVNLQPGAGRVLGLFSVAALPRRLSLDFSDLTDKGLAFDSVHGDFELREGDAYTSNLLLQGPAAEIGIAGRTGLGRRDYDQTAVVTGNLGASLPVAGALAGGPAVGAALLLFSQVFKEPLKGITRGYYRITGPWDEPVVERVDAGDVKASTNDGP